MKDKRVLLHIGYHKTATTWFQDNLFPQHDAFATPLDYKQIARAIVWPHPLGFDARATRKSIDQAFKPAWKAGRVPVLSAERLSGNPTSGGFDSKEIADRLAATLPEGRVWIAIREQGAMIGSYYKQYVQEGGTASLKRMLAGDDVLKRIPHFRMEHFEYLPLIRHYQSLFGRDQVLVTLYEEFRARPQAVLARACEFAGVEPPTEELPAGKRRNVSFSDRSIRILRASNGLFAHPYVDQRPVVRLPGRRVVRLALRGLDRAWGRDAGGNRIQMEARRRVAAHYADSNKALAKHLKLDLAEWGYPVA